MEQTNEDKEAEMAWLLSQMVDGELNKQQTQEMIRILSHNACLKSKWKTWHLIKTALESDRILIEAKRRPVSEGSRFRKNNA
ncbi:MAG: RseA family anti-sigma factor [Gammaproteobacteria bacterium]